MSFYKGIASNFPDLKKKMASAGLLGSPEKYVRDNFQSSLFTSFFIAIAGLFLSIKFGISLAMPFFAFIISFFALFNVMMRRVDVMIVKREKEIDRDVLFAGRFLLVKLNSGTPLINAIVDASKSYGVANKFFQEIVRDIDL